MNRIEARTAVFHECGKPFRESRVSLSPPNDDELIVEIEMCTICGSDVHTIEGRRPLAGPMVLGHEIIGRVVSLPDNAVRCVLGTPLQIGDRVTWSLHAACGTCFWCMNDLSQKCDHLFKYGHEPVSGAYPSTGGFASHCQIQAGTAVVKIPNEMPAKIAAPANCATATVVAAFRQVGDCRGRTILIMGAGMLGLTAAAMAADAGAAEIVVVDPLKSRSELARKFGATTPVTDLATAKEELERRTNGRGADISFDFSGQNDAVLAAIHFLRIGGQTVLVGSVFPTESISISPEMIVRRWLAIYGVHNYSAGDLVQAVRFLERVGEQFPFRELVSSTYSLDQIDEAIRFAKSGAAVRVGILPK